jgi:hypothetical protein
MHEIAVAMRVLVNMFMGMPMFVSARFNGNVFGRHEPSLRMLR